MIVSFALRTIASGGRINAANFPVFVSAYEDGRETFVSFSTETNASVGLIVTPHFLLNTVGSSIYLFGSNVPKSKSEII